MATAQLLNNSLLFTSNGTDARCNIAASADGIFRFNGPADAAVEMRNIAAATLGSSAAPLSQVESKIATQETAAAAARQAVADAAAALVTTEQNARSAADTVVANAAAAALTASEATAATARGVIDQRVADEETARQAADTSAAAANLSARNVLSAAISQEVSDRQAAVQAEATARANADASAATTNADARAVIVASVTAEVTRATAAEAAAQAAAISHADTIMAQEVIDRNKAVQDAQNGVVWKQSVRCLAGSAAVPSSSFDGTTMTASANGALVIDSVSVAAGDRVLLAKEADAKNHGIYTVQAAGDASNPWSLQRAEDFNSDAEIVAAAVLVREGSTYQDQAWIMTTDSATLNTSALAWSVFSTPGEHSAGSGLQLAGKEFSISTAGVSTAMIQDNACTEDKMAPNSVGSSQLKDDACDTAAIQDDAVTDAKCNFTHVQASQATFSGACQAQTYVASSDKNLKMAIEPLTGDDANEILSHLPSYKYRFKSEPVQERYGTIAQDCLENEATKDFVRADPETGQLSVCYQDIIMVLCASLKDCQERLSMIEADMVHSD